MNALSIERLIEKGTAAEGKALPKKESDASLILVSFKSLFLQRAERRRQEEVKKDKEKSTATD